MDVLDEFMTRHSSTSKGIMAVDKNLSDQQKKEEGETCSLLAAGRFCFFDAIQGSPKNWHHFLYALTLLNSNRFSKLFHCQN